jgi:ABC-type multidrug transport system fused ATPase/permease subunit
MVMDEGRIVDIGSHDELMGRCAIYQRLQNVEHQEAA